MSEGRLQGSPPKRQGSKGSPRPPNVKKHGRQGSKGSSHGSPTSSWRLRPRVLAMPDSPRRAVWSSEQEEAEGMAVSAPKPRKQSRKEQLHAVFRRTIWCCAGPCLCGSYGCTLCDAPLHIDEHGVCHGCGYGGGHRRSPDGRSGPLDPEGREPGRSCGGAWLGGRGLPRWCRCGGCCGGGEKRESGEPGSDDSDSESGLGCFRCCPSDCPCFGQQSPPPCLGGGLCCGLAWTLTTTLCRDACVQYFFAKCLCCLGFCACPGAGRLNRVLCMRAGRCCSRAGSLTQELGGQSGTYAESLADAFLCWHSPCCALGIADPTNDIFFADVKCCCLHALADPGPCCDAGLGCVALHGKACCCVASVHVPPPQKHARHRFVPKWACLGSTCSKRVASDRTPSRNLSLMSIDSPSSSYARLPGGPGSAAPGQQVMADAQAPGELI